MPDWTPIWTLDWLDFWPPTPTGTSGTCEFGPYVVSSASSEFGYEYQFVPFLDVEVPLYIIGWAYEGECWRSHYVRSLDQADLTFGGRVVHEELVTAGQSQLTTTLPIAPSGWSLVESEGRYRVSGVRLVGNHPLVRTVAFDPVPSNGKLVFTYHPRPIREDTTYLPALIRSALALGCRHVVGVRVGGGGKASATWGDWTVRARREGALYNGTRVTVTADRLDIAVPHRPVRSYAYSGDPAAVWSVVEEVEFVGPNVWPVGCDVILSGGYTALFTGASLLTVANHWTPEVPGVVLVPAMSVGSLCQDVARAFGTVMTSAHCAVVFSTSIQNIWNVAG